MLQEQTAYREQYLEKQPGIFSLLLSRLIRGID